MKLGIHRLEKEVGAALNNPPAAFCLPSDGLDLLSLLVSLLFSSIALIDAATSVTRPVAADLFCRVESESDPMGEIVASPLGCVLSCTFFAINLRWSKSGG